MFLKKGGKGKIKIKIKIKSIWIYKRIKLKDMGGKVKEGLGFGGVKGREERRRKGFFLAFCFWG